MLSFEHKQSIFRSFKELQEKSISKERTNYFFPDSLTRGKILARELDLKGNGYVNGKHMSPETIREKGYKLDRREWIKIKNFSSEELKEVIIQAMISMSGKSPVNESDITGNQQDRSVEAIQQETQEDKIISNFEELVRSCLYNWIGYGNINAPIWFFGMEEGGAEIWRIQTKTLEQSLELRSKFKSHMDFRHVWEDLYGLSLETFRGANVWNYMVAFLLEWEGRPSDPLNIHDYIYHSKQLGREGSNHFLGELMPLPKPSKGKIAPYLPIWRSARDYELEVSAKRFSLIREAIVQNENVKLLVSYNKNLTDKFLEYFSDVVGKIDGWQFRHESYSLYKIVIENDRPTFLLSTPFFGNGQISYNGIKDAARRIHTKEII